MIPCAAVFFLSCAAVAYEVLLVRWLHIAHDHPFAVMILSLALLGYGAGGTALTLTQDRLLRRPTVIFAAAALSLSGAVLLSPGILRAVSFNPLEILWDISQTGRLAVVFVGLSLPFFMAGTAVGLAFRSRTEAIHRLYLADLCGAGSGAVFAVALLHFLDPPTCLRVVSLLGTAAAGMCPTIPRFLFSALLCGAAGVGLQVIVPDRISAPHPFPYKGLPYALKIPEARILAERFGPSGWVVLMESPAVPFRHAPGLSLTCAAPVSEQLGLFIDGDGPAALLPRNTKAEDAAFLDCLLGSLPYRLAASTHGGSRAMRVLVLGFGDGLDVPAALRSGASTVHLVERNRDVIELAQRFGAGFDPVGESASVKVDVMDPRRFVETTAETFQVIQLSGFAALSASKTGGASLLETYDATVEAFERFLDRLEPEGFLSVPHALQAPPQTTVRVVDTAAEALRRRGISDAADRIAVVHHWNTALMLVKNGVLDEGDRWAIRRLCAEQSLDLAWLPGMMRDEAERVHRLRQGSLHEAVAAVLRPDASRFAERYPFRIDPATDDRPYALQFFRWTAVPSLLSERHGRGAALIQWGVPVLLATLLQATAAAMILVAAPVLTVRKLRGKAARASTWRTFGYFGCLGLAFLFVETAAIQKNGLFLGHPVSGFAGTVGPFLFWAGWGSLASRRWAGRLEQWRLFRSGNALSVTAAGVGLVVLGTGWAWSWAVPRLLELSDPARWVTAALAVAPAAFLMGMPFPLGLRALAESRPDALPWAWTVNGCASVLSALLAALLSLSRGFSAVVVVAAALYFLAALIAPSR